MKQLLLIGTALLSFPSYASDASSSDSDIAEHLNSAPSSSPSTNCKSIPLHFVDKISELSSSEDVIKLLKELPVIDDEEVYLKLGNFFLTKGDAFINDITQELESIARDDTNKLNFILGHIRNIFITHIENPYNFFDLDKPFDLSLISKFNSIESPLLAEKIKKQVISPLPLIISNCKNYIEMYVNSLRPSDDEIQQKHKIEQEQLLNYYKKLKDDFKTSFPDAGITELMKLKKFCIDSIEIQENFLKGPKSLSMSENELRTQINRTLQTTHKVTRTVLVKEFDKVMQKAFVEDLLYEVKLQKQDLGSKLDQIADIVKIIEMIKAGRKTDLESKVELLAETIKDLRKTNPDLKVGQLAIIEELPNVIKKFREANPNFKIKHLINKQISLILKLNSEFYRNWRDILYLTITSEPLGKGYYRHFRQIVLDRFTPILQKAYDDFLERYSEKKEEEVSPTDQTEIETLVLDAVKNIKLEMEETVKDEQKTVKGILSSLFYDPVIYSLVERVIQEIVDTREKENGQDLSSYQVFYNNKLNEKLNNLLLEFNKLFPVLNK